MSPEQIALVQSSFVQVKAISDTAATLFYSKLFELAPEVRPMFSRDIKEQGALLMATLGTAVALLKRPAQLKEAVEALGQRHAGYGVTASHFEPVGQALIWTLEKGLGPSFTPELRAAWVALYQSVTVTMLSGMEKARRSPPNDGGAAQRLAASSAAPAGSATRTRKPVWWKRLWQALFR